MTQIRSATWSPSDAPSAYESVYERLRRDLIRDVIAPGARLLETELAERLDVSRTPVREALRRLESDGLVQRSPNGGLHATPTGPDDLGDIGLLRIEVDGLAARLAAARGTPSDWEAVHATIDQLRDAPDEHTLATRHRDLHRQIYAIGFSPRLAGLVTNHLLPYIEEAVNVGPGFDANPEGSARQHRKLVNLLASGDAERAESAARAHARSGVRYAKAAAPPRTGGRSTPRRRDPQ